jgi:PTH1 family peptidyl-tRNA hydrolase
VVEELATRVIAGLGNPGSDYATTRHNVGFRIVDLLARRHALPEWRRRGNRLQITGTIAGRGVILVKPLTYMNRSGIALTALQREAPYQLDELLVCYDDYWLPIGRIRIRARGSHGGHNGMRSVIERLGSEEIPRLRLGVASVDAEGRMIEPADSTEFVLDEFRRSERLVIDEAIERAADAVECVLAEDLITAMNRFNPGGGATL